jgi:hypothetical protein
MLGVQCEFTEYCTIQYGLFVKRGKNHETSRLECLLARHDIHLPRASGQVLSHTSESSCLKKTQQSEQLENYWERSQIPIQLNKLEIKLELDPNSKVPSSREER